MCRIVTLVVLSLISFVLSSPANDTAKEINEINCHTKFPILNEIRKGMQSCFKDIVQVYGNDTEIPGKCKTVYDFGRNLTAYYDQVKEQCKYNFTINNEKLLSFIEFSLKNISFKEFYSDIECVQRMEGKISQCVKDIVGNFNITEKHKHSSWYRKMELTYDQRSCDLAREVQHCTEEVLNSCKTTTCQYVTSLFEFSLKNCKESAFNQTSPSSGTPMLPASALITLLTVSVLILTVGKI